MEQSNLELPTISHINEHSHVLMIRSQTIILDFTWQFTLFSK